MMIYPEHGRNGAEILLARQRLAGQQISEEIKQLVRNDEIKRPGKGDKAIAELKMPKVIVTGTAHTLMWLGNGHLTRMEKNVQDQMNNYLAQGGVLVIITGWGKDKIDTFLEGIEEKLKTRVIIAPNFGEQIFGYDMIDGKITERTHHSRENDLSKEEKSKLFKITDEVYDLYDLGKSLVSSGQTVDFKVPYRRRSVIAAMELDGRMLLNHHVAGEINRTLMVEKRMDETFCINFSTDSSNTLGGKNGEVTVLFDLRQAIKRYIKKRLQEEGIAEKVEVRDAGTGGLNITLKGLNYETAFSTIRDRGLIEAIDETPDLEERDMCFFGAGYADIMPKATHISFQLSRLLRRMESNTGGIDNVYLCNYYVGPNGVGRFLDELLKNNQEETETKPVSDVNNIAIIARRLELLNIPQNIVREIRKVLSAGLKEPEDHWFYSRLIRLTGVEDERQPSQGKKHYYPRAKLNDIQQKLINAVTPVLEFDKDETLDLRSRPLSNESAVRLAKLIVSGRKVGINTAKALGELEKKIAEIYKPLRTAVIDLIQVEGWETDTTNAADDLLCDLFELFLDTAASRLVPERGAASQKELIPDEEYQAGLDQHVVSRIREQLVGESMDPRLKRVIQEEKQRLADEGYEDYLPELAALNIYSMELKDGTERQVITKLEYRPFGKIALDERKEKEKFESNKKARLRVVEVIKIIFNEMGIGNIPQNGNYGILPVAAGSRSVDLNMLLPGGQRIQKDRAIKIQFDRGYRDVSYFDNEALAGNGLAVAKYNKILRSTPGTANNLRVYAVDVGIPVEMEGKLKEHGVIFLGDGIDGTERFIEAELENINKAKRILIGVPVVDLKAKDKKKILTKLEDIVQGEATIIPLLGKTVEENIHVLEQLAAQKKALRVGLVDISLKDAYLERILGAFLDRASADLFSLTHGKGIEKASAAELKEACKIHQPVISLDLNRKSVYEFEDEVMDHYSKNQEIYSLSRSARTELAALKDSGEKKFVVWTSNLETMGLPFAADIRQRRKDLNATKESDPIVDVVVITDKKIASEQDPEIRKKLIKEFIKAKGLDDIISEENVILCDSDQNILVQDVISRLLPVYPQITPKDIILGGLRGDFKYDQYGADYKVFNLADGVDCNIGMYKYMIETLFADDIERFSNVLQRDVSREGWYYYLPPVAPEEYEELYQKYKKYIAEVLTKA